MSLLATKLSITSTVRTLSSTAQAMRVLASVLTVLGLTSDRTVKGTLPAETPAVLTKCTGTLSTSLRATAAATTDLPAPLGPASHVIPGDNERTRLLTTSSRPEKPTGSVGMERSMISLEKTL